MNYKEAKYIVYRHISPSGKSYIGITHQKPNLRWRLKGQGYKQCPVFYNAILKYGWKSFKHEILFENLTFEDACKKEIELIKEYNSLAPNGYNVDVGGYSGTSLKKRIIAFNQDLTCRLYDSITDAASDIGIDSSTISHVIETPKCGGEWFYVYAD